MSRFFVLLMISFSILQLQAQTHSKQNPYPKIEAEQGKSSVKQKGEELKGKRLGRMLRESVLIETEPNALVRLDLSPTEYLVVGGSSRVLIPGIDWEAGTVPEIELQKGGLFLELKEPRMLKSALFRETLPAGRYEFVVSPEKPEIEALVFEGSLAFRGLETEQKSVLNPSEAQSFRGEIDNGQVQYDILLGGRQVARGQLLPKTRLADAEFLRRANQYVILKKMPAKAKAVPQSERGGPSVRGDSGRSLCAKPSGEFNQCAWICENNPRGKKICDLNANSKKPVQCVRRRCLANGQWGDELIYTTPESPCTAKVQVLACDY